MIDKFWVKLRSYVKPTSLTWWAGLAMVVSGIIRHNDMNLGPLTTILRPILMSIEPGNALMMIFTGFGLMGLRGAINRKG